MSERHYGNHEIMNMMTLFLSFFFPSSIRFLFITLFSHRSIVVFFIGCGYLSGSLGCVEPRLTDSRRLDGFRSFPQCYLTLPLRQWTHTWVHSGSTCLAHSILSKAVTRISPSSVGSLRVLFTLLFFFFYSFAFSFLILESS
ncbi:hypothetical protein M747DRAFT_148972 [Aspergillus niger ATCC 13496]|uniref:Uncharacterized protein n=1 Tax=Aspergillus niger ATCC 13496 TaxID=1353008 RepID=A0A370CAZ5_ASPNG|nr:hypothetical protein M747DRAFT_148972 [Aspergillus niger ATCC 13496]